MLSKMLDGGEDTAVDEESLEEVKVSEDAGNKVGPSENMLEHALKK